MQKELISLRKRNEKHFLNDDGTIQALIYNEDVHCLKDGVYEEINNTLVESNERYINMVNDINVSFSKCADENLITIFKDNHYLKMNIVGSNRIFNKKLKKDNKIRKKGSISYLNIFENIDLNYKILSNKIKENIIINDKSAIQDKIVFNIVTDLELTLDDNKIISNSDLFIDKSFMVDSNDIVNDNLQYELNKKNNYYELVLYLDRNWLENENRKYPVYIDPTITTKDIVGLEDVYIKDIDPDSSFNRGVLHAGTSITLGTKEVERSLIKFGLPTIGTGSTVIDAQLIVIGYLSSLPILPNITATLVAHQITQNWDENTATWNTMHDKYNKLIEDYTGFRYSYTINDTEAQAVPTIFNITNLVKKWYAGVPNYGLMIKSPDESDDDNLGMFYAKEATIGDGIAPFLSITYRNQNGLENYLTYETQNLGNGSLYFGHATGNMTANFHLGCTTGGSMPMDLSLFYNTNDVVLNKDYGFGKGMKCNLIQTIKNETIENKLMYKYVDGDGTIHYFSKKTKEDGTELDIFTDENNLGLTLTITDTICTVEDKDKNKMIFTKINGTYYLTNICDTEGHTSTIEYANNKLSKIIDAYGSEITITYNNSKIVIVSPTITTALTLNNNKITKIENDLGTTNITYNDKDIISNIEDITGKKYQFKYYDVIPYRIKKIQELGMENELGNSLEFVYGFQATTVKDKDGKEMVYTFNEINNTVSKAYYKTTGDIGNAYGKMYGYNTYAYLKNKLTEEKDLIKPIRNLLWNSSFEKDDITFVSKADSMGNELSISYSDVANTGFRSMKLEGSGIASYIVNIDKSGYYTFSFYSLSSKPMRFCLIPEYGESFIGRVSATNNFDRSYTTIEITQPGNLEIQFELWNDVPALIDDIQLEEGKVANPYNLVDNNDFHLGLAGWSYNNYEAEVKGAPFVPIVTNGEEDEIITLPNGHKALKLVCGYNVERSVGIHIPQNGKAGDTYYISFWYKNEGVSCRDYELDYKANHMYAQLVNADPDHGTGAMFGTPLNPNNTEWQFYSTYLGEDYDHTQIDANFLSLNACNYLYITDLTIIKDYSPTAYNYDEEGNVTSSLNKNKSATDFKYDANNQLIKVTNPLGNNLYFEYDNTIHNRILSGVSPTGITNQIKYDHFGNPIVTKIHAQTQVELKNGKYYIRKKGTDEYLKTNPVSKSIYPSSNTCSHEPWEIVITDNTLKLKPLYYDHVYILDSVLDELNLSFISQDNGSYLLKYNNQYLTLTENGLLFKDTEDLDNQQFYFESIDSTLYIESEAEYTEDGKYLISITDTLFNKTSYDIDTNKGLINSVTDALGNETTYTYNDKNQIKTIKKGDMSVNYEYNAHNLLSKISQGNKAYGLEYDPFLNTKAIKIGNQKLIENEYEEKNGNLLSSTYGNGQEITYEYDEFNRISKVYKNNETYVYHYDNFGNLVRIVDGSGDYSYQYDFAQRPIRYSKGAYIAKYQYNDTNNLIEKQESLFGDSNQYNYEYNTENNISKITNRDTTIIYDYDELGRVTGQNIDNFITRYGYLTNGYRTSGLIDTLEQCDNVFKYRYDKFGNIIRILKNGETIHQYYYDLHNQLVKEKNSDGTIVYTYDNYGNIKNRKIYNNENTLLNVDTYSYENSNWQDQLTKYNDTIITYDEIGNPTQIGYANLTWINGRQLSKYEDSNKNLVVTYKYNKDGIRTQKTVNGAITNYYVEGNKIIYCEINNHVLYFMYSNGELIGFRYGDNSESFYYYNTYYYVRNLQGDIISIKNSDLETIATYEYDSWGRVVFVKDNLGNEITDNNHIALINPFRYRGYYYDGETELYYLNSRYYNPTWGRFINADNFITTDTGLLGYNMYLYCNNNFIIFLDPSGHILFSMVAALATAGAIMIGVTVYENRKSKKEIKSVQDKYPNSCPNPIKSEQFGRTLKENAASIQNDTKYMNGIQKVNYFIDNVKDHAKYDLKNTGDWDEDIYYNFTVLESQDIGNFNFGYIGRALGYDIEFLTTGAGLYQVKSGTSRLPWCITPSRCDDPRDTYYIRMGAMAYDSDNK